MHDLIIPCILYMLPYLLFLAYSSDILVKDSQRWKLSQVLNVFLDSYFFFVKGDIT
jgi:hypothetical protein